MELNYIDRYKKYLSEGGIRQNNMEDCFLVAKGELTELPRKDQTIYKVDTEQIYVYERNAEYNEAFILSIPEMITEPRQIGDFNLNDLIQNTVDRLKKRKK